MSHLEGERRHHSHRNSSKTFRKIKRVGSISKMKLDRRMSNTKEIKAIKKSQKYLILFALLLAVVTVLVFGISYLKSFRIEQPTGTYIARQEAEHLESVLLEKTGKKMEAVVPGNGEEEWLTYGEFQNFISQMREQGILSEEIAAKYSTTFSKKYKPEHYFLETDFVDSLIGLSEKLNPDQPIHKEHIIWIAGAENVSILSREADQNDLMQEKQMNENELLTEDAAVVSLSLSDKSEETTIAHSFFGELDCLGDENSVYYIRARKNADLELKSCFSAGNGERLKVFWKDYFVSVPNQTDYKRMEDVVDLSVKDGALKEVSIYQNKVHGKLLSVNDSFVELSMENGQDNKYYFADQMHVYKLFGDTESEEPLGILGYNLRDLKIGYDFTDFVMNEDNKVVAALATREETMSDIRVLIRTENFESVFHDNIELQCDTAFVVRSGGKEKQYGAGEKVSIEKNSELFETDRIFIIPASLTARTSITSLQRNQGTPAYRGQLELVRTDNGLLCINELLLEEYLYSVVPSEMPSSYPLEAQKAQAISARTYAYQHMEKSSLQKFGAHVDDSVAYQVYNNIEETEESTQAVKETKGKIAMIDGEVAGTYFYSTSCGFGVDTSVWHSEGNENTRHLHTKAISANPALTPEQVQDEAVFRDFIMGKQEGDFESEEGWYRWTYETELDMERLMDQIKQCLELYPDSVLTLQSDGSFVSQPIVDMGSITQISVNKRLPGGPIDELDLIGTKNTIRVVGERTIRIVLTNQSDYVMRQTGDKAPVATMIPSAFAVIDTVKEKGEVTGYKVTGGGYGHGIGMSQNGSKNMAEAGYDCDEIMQFFYEGIELKNLSQTE